MEPPSQPPPKYRPAPLASLPPQLDPAEYDASPEKRRADAERLAIRARLKRDYLLKLNDPRRTELIHDPALTRWVYARSQNVYPNFRATPKTSLFGALFGLGPVFFWWYVIKKKGIIKRSSYRKASMSDRSIFPIKSSQLWGENAAVLTLCKDC